MTEAATGQDTQSQISSVTGALSVQLNNGAQASGVANVACLSWPLSGIPDGPGVLLIEAHIGAEIANNLAFGVGLAIDPDDLSASASAWAGLIDPSSGAVKDWVKSGSGASSGSSNASARIVNFRAIFTDSDTVSAVDSYTRLGTDAASNAGITYSTNANVIGDMTEIIVVFGRSADSGVPQTLTFDALRYRWVAD